MAKILSHLVAIALFTTLASLGLLFGAAAGLLIKWGFSS